LINQSKISITIAKDPDPLDPQHFPFGFLDPDKYADSRIRIQGAKYQPETGDKTQI